MIVNHDDKGLTEAFAWLRGRVVNADEPLMEITPSETDGCHRRYVIFAIQFFYQPIPRMGETRADKFEAAESLARKFVQEIRRFDLFVST